jgi:hypothetical protein
MWIDEGGWGVGLHGPGGRDGGTGIDDPSKWLLVMSMSALVLELSC